MPDGMWVNEFILFISVLLLALTVLQTAILFVLWRQQRHIEKELHTVDSQISSLPELSSQMQALRQASESLGEKERFEGLKQQLEDLSERLDAEAMENARQAAAAAKQPAVRWQELVQSAVNREPGALQALKRAIAKDKSVHLIGIANLRKYQNNSRYAEFSVKGDGECVLIPTDDALRPYIALPFPGGEHWFARNYEMLGRLFRFDGDWRNINAVANVGQAAVLREKPLPEDGDTTVYELVEPGVLRF